jgi:hypothetical protein
MNCPHCGFANQEGRRYCRGCSKPLASEPAASKSPEPIPDQADPTPVNPPSVDSFATNASAPSSPALNKKVIAIAAVLVVVLAALVFWFTHKSDLDQDAQSRTTQSPVNSVAYRPDAASLKSREHLMAALRLIVAQQEARLAEDPDDLNVCGVNVFGNDDLGEHVRQSHYIIDQQCQPRTPDGRAIRTGFTVTAIPKSDSNPADAPTYCVDQTKIIRGYADLNEVHNATSVQHLTCPLDGQPVE